MKKIIGLAVLFMFPYLSVVAHENPAIYRLQNIEHDHLILEDESVWRFFLRVNGWRVGDAIVIDDGSEHGFHAVNQTRQDRIFVYPDLNFLPKTTVVDVGEYIGLSNGIVLKRVNHRVEVGDHIFLCGYSIGHKASKVNVWNRTKNWLIPGIEVK